MRISDWSSDVCSSDLAGGVVGGEGREETGHFEDQIRTPLGQPGTIVRGLVVPPGVVGDGQADVVLAARVVGHPPSRAQVEELFGCLLRSEEHTSELQSLMRISYAVFCLKNKKKQQKTDQ